MIAQTCRIGAQQQLLASLQISNALRCVQIDVDQTIDGLVVLRKTSYAFLEIFNARLVDGFELTFAKRCVGALETKTNV